MIKNIESHSSAQETIKKNTPIGFIGCGKMAKSLASRFVKSQLIDETDIHFFDINPSSIDQFLTSLPEAKLHESNQKVVDHSKLIFLAIKPQNIQEVANSLKMNHLSDKLIISILAGISLDSLYHFLKTKRVIRVMPNTPCLIGEGASAFSLGLDASKEDEAIVKILLDAVGISYPVEEKDLDIVTAISGSGPAFVLTMIESFIEAAVLEGLQRKTAEALILQTFIGASRLMQETGLHPAVLKNDITSPGGTTALGLYALEKGNLRSTLIDAIIQTALKSRELGRKS